MSPTLCHPTSTWKAILSILAVLLCLALAQNATVDAPAQAPSPTQAPPGTGGVLFGTVRVITGNNLPRNAGMENQPPVWMTLETKGTSAVVTIGNATRVPLDFTGTVVISLAPNVQTGQVLVSVGTAVLQGNQVVWSGFSLASGQIAPAIVGLSAGAASGQSTSGGTAILAVSIEATETQSGSRITEQVAGGGPTLAALAAAPRSLGGVSGSPRAVSATSGGVQGNAVPLSRSAARTFATWAFMLLASVLVVLGLIAWMVYRSGRLLGRMLRPVESSSGGDRSSPVVARLEAAVEALERASSTRAEAAVPGPDSEARPQPRGSQALLEVEEGAEPGRRWVLDGTELSIGRNPRNVVILLDPRVSDMHARVARQADGPYVLTDNGSTNGTLLNGRLVREPVVLHDGDLVGIGGTIFVFHNSVPAPAL